MFNPENAAGTVQFISKLAVQKISGKTMKKNIDGITVQQAKFTKLALDQHFYTIGYNILCDFTDENYRI